MNIILTKRCDKNCSYCFTPKQDRSDISQQDMSLETIKKLLYKYPKSGSSVRLLGGEPTQHPQFIEIVEELLFNRETEHLFIISNFLWEDKLRNYFVYLLKDKNLRSKISFLSNGTELNVKNRMPIFKKNYETIYDIFNARGVDGMTISTTLTDYNSYEYYVDYYKWLFKELNGKIKRMRFGIDLSNMNIINNTKYGDIIYHLYQEYVLKEKIAINADCIVPQCVFSEKIRSEDQDLFFSNNVESMHPVCCKNNLEIYADLTGVFCYDMPDRMLFEDVLKYPTGDAISKRIKDDYQVERKNIKIAKECLECSFYEGNGGVCQSLCLRCYNNNV